MDGVGADQGLAGAGPGQEMPGDQILAQQPAQRVNADAQPWGRLIKGVKGEGVAATRRGRTYG
jgi:hypothetical protein